MESPYYLRCLSQPMLFSPGGDPIKFRTRKHFALLVYLAAERRAAQRRDHLAELLWGGATAAEGRHSLATALSVLRAKLGREALECTRETVRLVHPSFRVDLERLEIGDYYGPEDGKPTLEVAGFLDGFELPDAPGFMHWKDSQQARWLPDIRTALIEMMDRYRRTGDSRGIEALADRMLLLDELSEEGIRAKMEARAFAGDRLTALKIFEEWQVRLAEELGAQPSALLDGMATRLRRRGWERPVASPIPSVPTDQWKDRPFIGRGAEYRVAYESWEATQRGEPRHVVLLGDSGIGKSTLAARLATAAGLEGASVARTQCYELEREIPYAAVSALVVGLLERPGVSATPPEALAELTRTVPEVRRRFPNLPAPPETQGETARIRLGEAFYELVSAVAEEHPVILVVDDLHHADDASIAVLHLVLRRARQQPVMAVMMARTVELLEAPSASRLRENAQALGLQVLDLPPMSEQESLELVESCIPTGEEHPGLTVRRSLIRAAAGYPMVLELLVQDWCASGDQCLGLSVGAMTAEPGLGGAPVTAYRSVIERLTRSLDTVARNVLNLAAVLGNRLNDLPMYSLADLTLSQTMSGMTRLTALRLLRDGGNGLEFSNELVRAHVYIGVPSPLRKALHSRMADHLLNEQRCGNNPSGLEIAWHCIRASRPAEAIPHLLQGAEDAITQGALTEAERALCSALPQLGGMSRITAALLLAEIQCELGDWSACLATLDTHCDSTADTAIVHALRVTAKLRLAHTTVDSLESTLEHTLALLERARTARAVGLLARAAAILVGSLRDSRLAKTALDTLNLIDDQGSKDLDKARVALSKAQLLYHQRRMDDSYELLRAEVARGSFPLSTYSVNMLIGLGSISMSRGEYATATEHLVRAQGIAARIGNDQLDEVASANLALCHMRLGDYSAQLQYSTRALKRTDRSGWSYTRLLSRFALGAAQARLGQPSAACATASELLQEIGDEAPIWLCQAKHLYAAEIFWMIGRTGEAQQEGRTGTSGTHDQLHCSQFAGLWAKWVLRTSGTESQARDTRRVSQLLAAPTDFDANDLHEIRVALENISG